MEVAPPAIPLGAAITIVGSSVSQSGQVTLHGVVLLGGGWVYVTLVVVATRR